MAVFVLQFFVVATLVAVAAAAPSNTYNAPAPVYHAPAPAYHAPAPAYHQTSYKEAAQPYQFDYAVHDQYTGTVFSQSEHNDGKTGNGYYTVQLPDGRQQTVKYVADQQGYGGYNAEVTYEGEARYDDHKPSYKPVGYAAPAYKPTHKPASYAAPSYKPVVHKPSYH